MPTIKKAKNARHSFAWLLVITGAIGTFAALALTQEFFNSLKNPHYIPVCNLNPIFSCSNVMQSHQAHIFGFPNEFIGIVGFAAITTIGVGLLAGAVFRSWFWRWVNLGTLAAVTFVSWLQFETLYRIGALCIFCMITWLVTIPLFVFCLTYSLRHSHLSLGRRGAKLQAFILRHPIDITVAWYGLILILILKRFWYYFGNL